MSTTAAPGPTVSVCPACHGETVADAIFCGNPRCHKALGEFRFVREELATAARWHEVLADRIADFVGTGQFVVVHAVWLFAWVAINSGILTIVARFDDYPFSLLGIVLSIEALFITGFVLISQNRQNAHADKRAELDYEVNVRTYRRIRELDSVVRALAARLDAER